MPLKSGPTASGENPGPFNRQGTPKKPRSSNSHAENQSESMQAEEAEEAVNEWLPEQPQAQAPPLKCELPNFPEPCDPPASGETSSPEKRLIVSLDDNSEPSLLGNGQMETGVFLPIQHISWTDTANGSPMAVPQYSTPKPRKGSFERVLAEKLAFLRSAQTSLERAVSAAHQEECAAIRAEARDGAANQFVANQTRNRPPELSACAVAPDSPETPASPQPLEKKDVWALIPELAKNNAEASGPGQKSAPLHEAPPATPSVKFADQPSLLPLKETIEDISTPGEPSPTATSFATLDPDVTSRLELKGLWKEPRRSNLHLKDREQRDLDRTVSGILKRTVTTQLVAQGATDDYDDVKRSKGWMAKFITHPTSMKRFFWDVLGVMIMLYDTVIIPMQVFDMPTSLFTFLMGKVSLAYWTLDIGLSFLVGYYVRGVLEMRPMKIAIHYALTWFPFDVVIASLDWSVQIATGGETEGVGAKSKQVTRISRALRTLRTLRSLRLLRIIKMRHLLHEIQERFSSEYVHIILRMTKLIVAIALLNHFIACGWWAIGKDRMDQDTISWIEKGNFDIADVGFQYTTSLHWSLTQFTPASMEVVPTNTAERTYAVCTLLFAMVIFSSFVSSITATMTVLRELSGKQGKTKQFKVLRWYLKDNDISRILQIRIQKYLQHVVLRAKSHVPENQVELLGMLSKPLRMELRYTIVWPVFTSHAFFFRFEQASLQATRQLCSKAVEELVVAVGDTLFCTGEVGKSMYWIVSAKCLYQQAQRGGLRSNADMNVLIESQREGKHYKSQFLSEMSLWCEWIHKGELHGTAQGRCIMIHSEPFAEVLSSHNAVIGSARRYAAALIMEVNTEDDQVSQWRELIHEKEAALAELRGEHSVYSMEVQEEMSQKELMSSIESLKVRISEVRKNLGARLSDLHSDDIDLETLVHESFPTPDISRPSVSRRKAYNDDREKLDNIEADWDLYMAKLQGAEDRKSVV